MVQNTAGVLILFIGYECACSADLSSSVMQLMQSMIRYHTFLQVLDTTEVLMRLKSHPQASQWGFKYYRFHHFIKVLLESGQKGFKCFRCPELLGCVILIHVYKERLKTPGVSDHILLL
jgi:hypothetical protein